MPLYVALFYLLPDSAPLMKRFGENRFWQPLVNNYHQWYWPTRERVTVWHRKELERLDFKFRFKKASDRLCQARGKLQEQGISAGDPEYPTIRDFLPPSDWPGAS